MSIRPSPGASRHLLPIGEGKTTQARSNPRGEGKSTSGQAELVEVLLRIECGHAAEAGRGDRLTIDLVGDVAGGKHAGHAGHGRAAVETRLDLDVAVAHRQLPVEQRRVRRMADRYEH